MASKEKRGPVRRFAAQAVTGWKELPANVGWLAGKVGSSMPGEGLGERAKDTWRAATAAVLDATPGGPGSVETRLDRARDAAERAKIAENEAVAVATDARALSDEAARVNEEGRRHVRAVKADVERETKRRVAEAREKADAFVADERATAEHDAAILVDRASEEVDAQVGAARRRAEAAQQQAEAKIAEATELMAQARALADEAAEAASEAAQEALRQANSLADEASRQASAATDDLERAEQVRADTVQTAADIVRDRREHAGNGALKDMTKAELLDLAAAMGLEHSASMRKDELVTALSRETRKVH